MSDFSDYIPILIAVGIGIYQLFKFLAKGGGEKPKPSSPPTDPFGGGKGDGWEDLLEALGQKEKPKNSAPLPPPRPTPRIEPVLPKARTQAPPPVPRHALPEPRPIYVPRPEPVTSSPSLENHEFYHPTIAEASELKFNTMARISGENAGAVPGLSTPVLPSLHASRYRKFLSDRERFREAVVLREILDKPLALR